MENYQPHPQQPYILRSLPNATPILVLGILSIVFCGFIGLILGIIALSLSNKDRDRLEVEPNIYSITSVNNMKAGRTCAIIGVSLSALVTLLTILYLIFVGAILTGVFTFMGQNACY